SAFQGFVHFYDRSPLDYHVCAAYSLIRTPPRYAIHAEGCTRVRADGEVARRLEVILVVCVWGHYLKHERGLVVVQVVMYESLVYTRYGLLHMGCGFPKGIFGVE